MHSLVDDSLGANHDIKRQGDGGKRNESPPPKTSSPVKHIAGQKLQAATRPSGPWRLLSSATSSQEGPREKIDIRSFGDGNGIVPRGDVY
jgi:hypothetical protein